MDVQCLKESKPKEGVVMPRWAKGEAEPLKMERYPSVAASRASVVSEQLAAAPRRRIWTQMGSGSNATFFLGLSSECTQAKKLFAIGQAALQPAPCVREGPLRFDQHPASLNTITASGDYV